MSDDADTILKHQEALATKRANWDSWWEQIAYRVLPSSATFQHTTEEGEKRMERVFDTTAITACERFAAFVGEGYTPRDQFWHGLEAEDEDLREDQEVREYFDEVKKILFSHRYRPKANFTSQRHECYLSAAAFGNYAFFIDEEVGAGLRYRAIHMSEVFWAEDHQGRIDTLYRKFPLGAAQAVKKFGKQCPKKIADEAAKNPFHEFDWIHCVRPNEELKRGRQDYMGMDYASYYVACGEKSVVSRGGYHTFPFGIGRFMKGPRETYARSPAMAAWPAILTVNEQKKTVLRAGQKIVDPPTLLMEDGVLEAFNMRSGALNYGMLNSNGEALAKPFESAARIDIGIELMALEQKSINDAFMVSLFQILAEQPQMTATEVLTRLKEKSELLSPTTGRLESEDTGPGVERELDVLNRGGKLPPMPRKLAQRGGGYRVVYTSPLARARRANDALAIMRTIESAGVAAGLDPNVRHVLNLTESVREIADINGVPAKLVRTTEEVDELIGQEQQMRQLAAAAQLAPGVAGAAKDVAQAQQIRQQVAA